MNRIKIDPERVISDIDRNIFGGYLELGAKEIDIYAGVYAPDSPLADKDGLRSDVRTALDGLKHTNVRFPGGNFASAYRWRDGIGSAAERIAHHDPVWNSIISNEFGTDEFIRFCRKLKTEPYFCANCGDGDMREAADWVEYCNGNGNSALAKLRRKHGYHEPHNVKLWGIGNEVDGPWQVGYKTPQEYARAFTEFAKVMKWTDPTIKLVASAACFWGHVPLAPRFMQQEPQWVERAQLILEQGGNMVDFMAIHQYNQTHENDTFENFMAFGADFNERLFAYEGLIKSVCLERGIKHQVAIAVDEWGTLRLPERFERVHNHEDALATAQNMNAFIRHAGTVRLANFTSMVTAIGINNSTRPNGKVLLQTVYFPFELYRRTCGQIALDVFWDGDTFSGTYKNQEYKGIRTLDVAATLDDSGKRLMVYVINQSQQDALETAVSMTQGEFAGVVGVSVINGPDIKSENTDAQPNQVGIQKTSFNVSGKSFNYVFEPHSITALECAVK
jgi:alpha-N-arabinofuranosidase